MYNSWLSTCLSSVKQSLIPKKLVILENTVLLTNYFLSCREWGNETKDGGKECDNKDKWWNESKVSQINLKFDFICMYVFV